VYYILVQKAAICESHYAGTIAVISAPKFVHAFKIQCVASTHVASKVELAGIAAFLDVVRLLRYTDDD
jgi:hypothetical protein